ncbi:MAG: wax ester/triacylglycerol synthase family O-acyltransferase [Acidimicrobiia bacterium]|nr:wax ester/triacylglycerol synthase family O-acyltransferase [Acidimicrobiia bacterium]
MRAERRMTDLEAMMWNIEKDPYLSSAFGSLSILDQPPDMDRLARRMAYTASVVPRLRQRVTPALGRLAPPGWQEDPEFDLAFHLRRIALPEPGTERQLRDLATLIVQDPFDRTRPLWEFVVIDGLEGGRAAMVQKMHHTITDGEGGIRMSERFVDLARDAEDPAPVDTDRVAPPEAGFWDTSLETLGHGVRRTGGALRRAGTDAWGTVREPARLTRLPGDLTETGRSMARQLLITDHAHSPLWTERTLRRRFETFDLPFDEARRAAKTLGGSLNDLFVTGAADAAGRYHAAKGAPVDELRMAMPISTRSDGSAGGNAFAPSRVLVPTGEASAVDRFEEVRQRLGATKGERAIGMVASLAGLLNVLPTSVLARFARQQVETIDFTTSNLRAAPFDLYIAGSRLEGNYPLGPISGTAFNLTMMSYRGSLNFGLHLDSGAVQDPDLLGLCLRSSYEAPRRGHVIRADAPSGTTGLSWRPGASRR